MSRPGALAVRLASTGVGLMLGTFTALLELGYLLISGLLLLPVLLFRRPRARLTRLLTAAARRLTDLDRARLTRWLAAEDTPGYPSRRAVDYLSVRWLIGLLGGTILLLLVYGAGFMAVWAMVGFRPDPGTEPNPLNSLLVIALGLVLFYLAVQGLAGVAELDRNLAARILGPSQQERLRHRISELSSSRSEVVTAVNNERRRIERDLHDGVQQRLVALGMLLGRARRGTSGTDDLGLPDVLADLADRCDVPVRLPGRAPTEVETVAYFVVSEGLTNVVKHAGATSASVHIGQEGTTISVLVSDDGVGSADPAGRGFTGLAGRVAAMDGRFAVHSPPGGPTTITAELPCG